MALLPAPLTWLPLPELEAACIRETSRFCITGSSDPRYCLELFDRALDRADRGGYNEEARAALVRIYSGFIQVLISRGAGDLSVDDLTQQAWLRFWQSANRGLEFHTLESALAYLKQVVLSTVSEARRQQRRHACEQSLQQLSDTLGDADLQDHRVDLCADYLQARFRRRCIDLLDDPLSRRVFCMRFSLGLPPREIARQLAGEAVTIRGRLATARAVSLLLAAACRSLRDDQEICDLLMND